MRINLANTPDDKDVIVSAPYVGKRVQDAKTKKLGIVVDPKIVKGRDGSGCLFIHWEGRKTVETMIPFWMEDQKRPDGSTFPARIKVLG